MRRADVHPPRFATSVEGPAGDVVVTVCARCGAAPSSHRCHHCGALVRPCLCATVVRALAAAHRDGACRRAEPGEAA